VGGEVLPRPMNGVANTRIAAMRCFRAVETVVLTEAAGAVVANNAFEFHSIEWLMLNAHMRPSL